MYTEMTTCRICGNANVEQILDLGEQAFTGVFPKDQNAEVETMPMQLVRCCGNEEECCGLVQLRHSGEPEAMYGMNYGYRSGLNQSMVHHLKGIYDQAMELGKPNEGDIVLDVGSNDCTLLKNYDQQSFQCVGMDPTGKKFAAFYPETVTLIPDFFSAENFQKAFGDRKAKIITSIAMFYDLPAPQDFVNDVAAVLADDGVWIFEQSYLPSMIDANAYDTVCHEHLEYYTMRQIVWLLSHANMTVLDASLNDSNGGSFRVTAVCNTHPQASSANAAEEFLARERDEGYHLPEIYNTFATRVAEHRDQLVALIADLNSQGKTVFGLGASTKGNVLLQYCNFTAQDIPYIAEVNEEKFGAYTPGSRIPILSQADADAKNPDYYMVLPWHFKDGITKGMRSFLEKGGKLIFPLPNITIVDSSDI